MSKPPFQVKALYDYSSPHEDDLSFSGGQVIAVTDEEDDDWYYGEFEDPNGQKQEGLFPKNFVKIFEPETPPRPSRSSRMKKDAESTEPLSQPKEAGSSAKPPAAAAQPATVVPPASDEPAEPEEEEEPATISEPQDDAPPVAASNQSSPPAPVSKKSTLPPPAPSNAASKPPAPVATKPPPPLAAEKPEKPAVGSFRDRINAFNKPAAPPVTPSKPSGLGSSSTGAGFVKKPFVAPPPSKNAYVPPPQAPPPQKAYRREEDPSMAASAPPDDTVEERAAPPPAMASDETTEEQPKPTSLKDRIALLQKQQMEQAARHAEKKEKTRKQQKKAEEEEEEAPEGEDAEEPRMTKVTSRDSHTRPRKSQDEVPADNKPAMPPRELLSDTNDADQSGAGDTEEGDELSPGRDDSDEKSRRNEAPVAQGRPVEPSEPKPEVDEDDEEEEDEIDPEVKRKMELRERMAKMSGGMGMAGMFGAPGGLPPRAPPKKGSASSQKKNPADSNSNEASGTQVPPVAMVPMPGLTRVTSPEQDGGHQDGTLSSGRAATAPSSNGHEDQMKQLQDVPEPEHKAPSRKSTERAPPPPPPQTRPVPQAPSQSREPPPLPAERSAPPPPPSKDTRPLPPVPAAPMSPSEGSVSDDELSSHAKGPGLDQTLAEDSDPITGPDTPQPPPPGPAPSLPSRPKGPESRKSDLVADSASQSTASMSPKSPDASKRGSRPPVPGSSPVMPFASQARAPPPPPPTSAPVPPSRSSTSNSRAPPPIPQTPKADDEEEEEEVTEYDGDYDTDMASSAPRKDALKAHARASSFEDDSMAEEASLHHSGLPSIGPPPNSAPRAAPPPPPAQVPKISRQSSDMPRAAPPPPPPPAPPISDEMLRDEDEEEYDPYRYTRGSGYRMPSSSSKVEPLASPRVEEPEDAYSPLPSQRSAQIPTGQAPGYSAPLNPPVTGISGSRQSTDIQRTSTTIRRSTDAPRASGEQGLIAADVDLGQNTRWWTQPEAPPPVFQNRRDVLFETEETSTTRRGGKHAITRTVYVLFIDYSQTVVTAHFDSREPSTATLEQHHEPPPRSLRQDQLEDAYANFSARIAEGANGMKDTVVGDGSPHRLPYELISAMPDALLPIGVRAYGALVYANLANASVQQFDEIRPGDILTFRNAKFQGHRGTMHSKYTSEVGKPDHVGIVLDWDGTKKKARAWEQGRESKKVKPESFKFGDLRSGEVKVWRVMARGWVGWESQT